MKNLILAFVLLTCFSSALKAQQKTEPVDLKKNIGKVITLCDTVYNVRIFNDTLTLINMSANYPNQKFTILVKNIKPGSNSFAVKFARTPTSEQYLLLPTLFGANTP